MTHCVNMSKLPLRSALLSINIYINRNKTPMAKFQCSEVSSSWRARETLTCGKQQLQV